MAGGGGVGISNSKQTSYVGGAYYYCNWSTNPYNRAEEETVILLEVWPWPNFLSR